MFLTTTLPDTIVGFDTQEPNRPWIVIFHPESINPVEGYTEIQNSYREPTTIKRYFTPPAKLVQTRIG